MTLNAWSGLIGSKTLIDGHDFNRIPGREPLASPQASADIGGAAIIRCQGG